MIASLAEGVTYSRVEHSFVYNELIPPNTYYVTHRRSYQIKHLYGHLLFSILPVKEILITYDLSKRNG